MFSLRICDSSIFVFRRNCFFRSGTTIYRAQLSQFLQQNGLSRNRKVKRKPRRNKTKRQKVKQGEISGYIIVGIWTLLYFVWNTLDFQWPTKVYSMQISQFLFVLLFFFSVPFWPTECNIVRFCNGSNYNNGQGLIFYIINIEFMFVARIWLSIWVCVCVHVPVCECVRLFVCSPVCVCVCKMAFNRIILWFVFSMGPFYNINPYASCSIYDIHFIWPYSFIYL